MTEFSACVKSELCVCVLTCIGVCCIMVLAVVLDVNVESSLHDSCLCTAKYIVLFFILKAACCMALQVILYPQQQKYTHSEVQQPHFLCPWI